MNLSLYIARKTPNTPGQIRPVFDPFCPGRHTMAGVSGYARDKKTASRQRSVPGCPGWPGGFGKGVVFSTPPFAHPPRAGKIEARGGRHD